MNREFVDWLSTQRLPMFDISVLGGADLWNSEERRVMCEAYEVFQKHPERRMVFECTLGELLALVQDEFTQLNTAVGEVALRTAIEDLRLQPWWKSAGPITEEIRYLLREGFKQLPIVLRHRVVQSQVVNKLLSNSPPQPPRPPLYTVKNPVKENPKTAGNHASAIGDGY